MEKVNNRRRVLRMAAMSTGMAVMPRALWANASSGSLYEWSGRALGAETSIQLYSEDKDKADEVLKRSIEQIRHYERVFSLYDFNSQVSELNREGKVEGANAELIELIEFSKKISQQSNGAFDITIQPLWNLYQDHFKNNAESDLSHKISKVLKLVGSNNINVDGENVSFAKEKMAVSFNGIAQGYITDKVADYLESQGFENTLIDIGEYRACGPQSNNDPWRIGLLDPFDQISINDVIELNERALATSSGFGDQFDTSGQHHHLFDPVTGLSSNLYASVTVLAENATTADALSTAFSNMSYPAIEKMVKEYQQVEVRLTLNDGKVVKLSSS